MKLIGFSSAALYHIYPRISKETFNVFRNIGGNAIELMCPPEGLEILENEIEKSDLSGFDYISLHTPREILSSGNIDEIKRALRRIEKINEKFEFQCIVVHPDGINDFDIFKNYNFKISIENEDNSKSSGQTVNDIKKILDKYDFGMVLDLNHCYVNDNSMNLARSFLAEFKDKIREIHISGNIEFHDPLHISRQQAIIDAMPRIDFPFIIESKCKDIEQAKKEFDFINTLMNKQ